MLLSFVVEFWGRRSRTFLFQEWRRPWCGIPYQQGIPSRSGPSTPCPLQKLCCRIKFWSEGGALLPTTRRVCVHPCRACWGARAHCSPSQDHRGVWGMPERVQNLGAHAWLVTFCSSFAQLGAGEDVLKLGFVNMSLRLFFFFFLIAFLVLFTCRWFWWWDSLDLERPSGHWNMQKKTLRKDTMSWELRLCSIKWGWVGGRGYITLVLAFKDQETYIILSQWSWVLQVSEIRGPTNK